VGKFTEEKKVQHASAGYLPPGPENLDSVTHWFHAAFTHQEFRGMQSGRGYLLWVLLNIKSSCATDTATHVALANPCYIGSMFWQVEGARTMSNLHENYRKSHT